MSFIGVFGNWSLMCEQFFVDIANQEGGYFKGFWHEEGLVLLEPDVFDYELDGAVAVEGINIGPVGHAEKVRF